MFHYLKQTACSPGTGFQRLTVRDNTRRKPFIDAQVSQRQSACNWLVLFLSHSLTVQRWAYFSYMCILYYYSEKSCVCVDPATNVYSDANYKVIV